MRRLAARDMRLQSGISRLQRRIAAAVVAVQVGVDDVIQRSTFECRTDQIQRLIDMRAIACVDQRSAVLADEEDVVAGEPTALEDLVVQLVFFQIYFPARSSRRKILPTFDLGKSSLNSMYLGIL